MFRLISGSGIFANSLHGREFCFERLSACKCRSPRKSPPRDYVKKPPAVELGKSSPENIPLWELMRQGCSCPRNTVKERWFFTNQHIILGLAKVLDRPPDAVSHFLYLLTLQNFSKIISPQLAPGNHCKVPLAYPNACEDYMRLFDTHGNIRSRFDHNSLMLLMRVMQTWLKRGAHRSLKPFDPCFGAAHCTEKARRAGIDPDSIAHRNGRRRLKESDERACLIRSSLIGYPAKGCPGYLFGSGNPSPAAQRSPVTIGDPGYVFGMHFVPHDLNGLEGLSSYGDELAAERARRLEGLLFQLNARTYLTRDAYFLIDAIKGIQVGKPRRKSARKSATDNSSGKAISRSYHKTLRESEIRSRLKNNPLYGFGKDSSQQRHLLHGKKPSHESHIDHKPASQAVEDSGPSKKLYYGAPIPVLMHEPYSQDKPWTWLNRHPHQTRMNDKGSIVKDKNIRRYRRLSVVEQMEKARERDSVYSVYTRDQDPNASSTDVPMFGRRSDIKPAPRKSLTRQSQVGQSPAPAKSGSSRRLVFS